MIVCDPTIRKILEPAARGLLIVLVLLFLAALVDPTRQIMAAGETSEVVAGVPANFPPEYQVDAHGKPYGFAIDLFEAVSHRSGIQVRYVVYDDFPEVISALKNGEVDLIPVLGIIEERQIYTDFTIPVVTFNIRIFTRDTTTDIHSLEDLAGRQVAVVVENQGYFIMETHPEVDLMVFQSMEEALLALISGNADAMVYPDVPLLGVARQSGIEERIKAVGEPLAEIKRAIGVRKGQPELVARLNETLQDFIHSDDYQKIITKWYGAPQPFWNTQRVLIAMGIALAFAGLLFFGLHYRSTLQLNQRLAKSLEETEHSRQALARWGQIFANAQWGVAVTGPDGGKFTLINPAFATMHGSTPEEMVGSPMAEVCAVEVRAALEDHLHLVGEHGHHAFESLHLRKDGTPFPVLMDITLVTDENGDPLYHVVNCQDISERVQADADLYISLEKYRVLFDSFPLGITVTDSAGRIIEANRESERLLGLSRQEYLDRAYDSPEWRIVRRDGSPMHVEEFASVRALRENRLVENVEMGIVKDSGAITWITVTAAPLPLPGYGVVIAYGDITVRIQAEEALREKSEEIERYFATSLDLFCIADMQGYFRRLNPQWEKTLGYSLADLQGRRFMDFVHPDDHPITQAAMSELDQYGEVLNFTNRYCHRDGSYRWIEWRSYVSGDVIYAAARDVTTRVEAENALRSSEETLRYFVEHSPAAIAMFDREMHYLVYSRRYLHDYGLGDQDLTGRSHYQVFPELLDRVKEIHRRCLHGAIERAEMDAFPRQDGGLDWVRWEMHPWHESSGEIGGVILFSEVITERVQAERELAASEARYRSFFENSLDAILLTSPDGGIQAANPAACQMLGRTEAEIIQTGRAGLIDASDPRLSELLAERAKTGMAHGELTMIRKDGTYFPVDISSAVFQDQNGDLRTSMIIRDITEWEQARQALEKTTHNLAEAQQIAHIGSYEWDLRRDRLEWSPELYRIYGLDESQQPSWELITTLLHPDDRGIMAQALHDAVAHHSPLSFDYRIIRSDGSQRNLNSYIYTVYDAAGFAVRSVGTVQDITERKQAEEEIQRKATNLAILLESSQTFISTVNLEVVFQATVDNLVSLTDLDSAAIYLCSEDQLYLGATTPPLPPDFPEDYRRTALQDHPHIQETLATGRPIILPDAREAVLSQAERELVEIRDLRSTLYIPIHMEGNVSGVLIVASCGRVMEIGAEEIDLCTMLANLSAVAIANARSFRAVNERGEQLRALTVRLAEVEEAERNHLARELHDRVGQSLTALNLNLNILRAEVPAELSPDIDNRLRDSLALVSDTMAQTRNVIDELRPSLLEDFGLVAALQDHCEAIARRAKITIYVSGSERRYPLEAAVENTFFRVAQEALNNVLKHASARQIDIRVTFKAPLLRMEIEDDGTGFEMDAGTEPGHPHGWGLITMQERIEALGGRLWIESQPGQGTLLVAEVAV